MGFLGLVAGVAAAVNGRRERRGEGWREREERVEREEEEVVEMAMAGGGVRGWSTVWGFWIRETYPPKGRSLEDG